MPDVEVSCADFEPFFISALPLPCAFTPELFEPAVQAFFGEPLLSHRGWETAAAAQQRIADALETVLARSPDGDVAIVSHGGVGTLLLCRLKGTAIRRAEDQPGQGHWFAFDRDTRAVEHGWVPL